MKSVRPAQHAPDTSTATTSTTRSSLRTCIGCRKTAERTTLLRLVVREVDGRQVVVPDPRRRLPGRGASLHPDPACLALAVRRKAIGRALRIAAVPDVSAVEALLARPADDAPGGEHTACAQAAVPAPSMTESGFRTP